MTRFEIQYAVELRNYDLQTDVKLREHKNRKLSACVVQYYLVKQYGRVCNYW